MSVYVMPFGKHKGVPIGDLPLPYLEWLAALDDLREPLASHVTHEFYRRSGQERTYQGGSARDALTKEERQVRSDLIAKGYRALALQYHPDHGGTTTQMQLLNKVMAALRQAVAS